MFYPQKYIFLIFIVLLHITSGCKSQKNGNESWEMERERMVENQIKDRNISNKRVLKAMYEVERHLFVPESHRMKAYKDGPLPIGHGQTISQPYIVALMTEYLEPGKDEKVLEVGTGSGYQAAVLSRLCADVYTIEIVPELAEKAQKILDQQGYENVHVKTGDGYKGWEAHAPYNGIIVTCSPSEVPEPLKDQLAEGGKMVIPVGGSFVQHLVVLEREGDTLQRKQKISVRFVPMLNEEGNRY